MMYVCMQKQRFHYKELGNLWSFLLVPSAWKASSRFSDTFCFISTQFNPSVPPIFLRIHVFCDRLRNLKQNFLIPYDSVLISSIMERRKQHACPHLFLSPQLSPSLLRYTIARRLRNPRSPGAAFFNSNNNKKQNNDNAKTKKHNKKKE